MISPLMVPSKNVKVSQKRCLGNSIESFTGSSPSEQIIVILITSDYLSILRFVKSCITVWLASSILSLLNEQVIKFLS